MAAPHAPYVLIVEDDPNQAYLLTTILESDGLVTQIAPDAETALMVLGTRPPALLTLDLNLPGLSGAELLQRLRATPALDHLPVILITAFPAVAPDVVSQAQALLIKPYDIDALLASVRAHLPPARRPCRDSE